MLLVLCRGQARKGSDVPREEELSLGGKCMISLIQGKLYDLSHWGINMCSL
jgi:hypothetical protein